MKLMEQKASMIGLQTTDHEFRALSDKALDSIGAQFSLIRAPPDNYESQHSSGLLCFSPDLSG
jgi:hypothetical protein